MRLQAETEHKKPLTEWARYDKTALFIEIPHIAPSVSKRFSSAIQLLNQCLHDGELGEISLVECFHSHLKIKQILAIARQLFTGRLSSLSQKCR